MKRGDPRSEGASSTHESEPRSAEGRAPGELLRVAQRAGGAAPSTNEDSGIIDLRALMASAEAKSDRRARAASAAELTPLPVVRHLPVYPLGDPAASRESEAPAPFAPRPSLRSASRIGLLLGVSVVLFAGAATMVLLPREGGEGAQAAPPPALAASLPAGSAGVPGLQGTPEALPAPTPPLDVAAPAEPVPPADGAAAAPVDAAPPPARPAAKKAVAVTPRPGAGAPKPSASAPAKASAPADTCKGDLLCAMKRATAGR